MNFVQWLSSLDELLYEVVSWLVFFPVTLWRIVRRPLATMRYAEEELRLEQEQQYRSTVSPPITLIIAILISQAISLAVDGINPIVASHRGLADLVDDNTSLLLLQILLFTVFALVMATRKVRQSDIPLDRDTLKPAFYAQCYATAPFALLVGLGSMSFSEHAPLMQLVGLAALSAGLFAFGTVQILWFRRELGQSIGRSIIDATIGMVESTALVSLVPKSPFRWR